MMLDLLIVVVVCVAVAFGWMARSDKAVREADAAYQRGYADALKAGR